MESFNSNLFLILWVICFVLTRVGLSKMFKSAGQKAVMAWIPILSWWYWIKIVGRPKWYMIGMVIPGVNILFSFNITLDILRSFGKNGYWQQLFGTVFSFIYFPILAFKDLKYYGPAGDRDWKEANVPKHNGLREWGDAILFAAYVAGGMRAIYFDLYQIPTPSMESNLMVGDYLVVSRAKIGMRIPMSPISVPVLSTKQILGVKAYSDLLELPYMRLPGWYTIKNNDIIVFNWPADDDANADGISDYKQSETGMDLNLPIDKKDNYVKRCVGIPGDRVSIVGGNIYINGKPLPIQPLPDFFDDSTMRYFKHRSETLGAKPHQIILDDERHSFIPGADQFVGRDNCNYTVEGVTCKVPEGHYFMLGDNRDNSLDSRYWGFVPDANIVGKAFFVWMNFGNLKRIGAFD